MQTTRYNLRIDNTDGFKLKARARSGWMTRCSQAISGMHAGTVYLPNPAALAGQLAPHDGLLQLGHVALKTELHRLPDEERTLLMVANPGYVQYPQQTALAQRLLVPMGLSGQRAWVNDLIRTTSQGRQALAPGPAAPTESWLPEETRIVCLNELWFLSLGFARSRRPWRDQGELIGVDVGLTPLASAAGASWDTMTRPLHLLRGAGLHALERHAAELSPAQRAEIEHRYANLVYRAAQMELNALTKQMIGSARVVAVENLKFGTFQGDFVTRARGLAVTDWIQSALPQRLYTAGIKLHRVSPAYTSQRCSRCNRIGQRDHAVFTCAQCGSSNAHTNAARNVRRRAWGAIRRGGY